MAPFEGRARQLLLAGGFAVAVAAAPAVAFAVMPSAGIATHVAACPAGETEDLYTDNCTPEMAPNVPGGNYATAVPGGTLPEVAGVPVTGGNSGTILGLEENQADVPDVTPHSSISSSP
ncbi:intersectin-EH binding protein Ibp1 [Mycolicibacterium komossense]|uniref:Intersectin-EH binding protein Ibp1 n=2 Tax=Mycolicibacterium komossense TaxID=1779 RepID=A0ABT3CN09_9MYCO|nr:intersectin-EH binding protein Ibp1 [Mycolicibacterium komossense]